MKTLEELGISPAPWRADTDEWGSNNEVLCDYTRYLLGKVERRTKVVARCNAHFDTYKPDTLLIAAAPELYEALYDVVSYCESTHLVPSERFGKVLAKAKAALAKASGEREAKE